MNIDLFYRKINEVIKKHYLHTKSDVDFIIAFQKFIEAIFEDENLTPFLKMTRMSVLFEGFYRFLPIESTFHKDLCDIRLERWGNHFGTPTITFLLTYNSQIEQTQRLFDSDLLKLESIVKPWEIIAQTNHAEDKQNNVIVNEKSTHDIAMPTEDEKTGQFLKTHNPSGGFTTTPCDPVSQKFIEYAANGNTILEVGAAFGAATLQALAKGATVFCNDIEPNNLAVVRKRYLKKINSEKTLVTGDTAKLVLVPGAFPDELAGLPKNFFDAILICRVLHFFSGNKIEQSLQQLSQHLKPGGKLFVVCETPFLKNWQQFIPEYELRVKNGLKWPGEISNSVKFESSGRVSSLPTFVHWITKEILERSLAQSKFGIEYLSYINRNGQFPKDLILDGRESVGAIAAKPY